MAGVQVMDKDSVLTWEAWKLNEYLVEGDGTEDSSDGQQKEMRSKGNSICINT